MYGYVITLNPTQSHIFVKENSKGIAVDFPVLYDTNVAGIECYREGVSFDTPFIQ